MQPYSLDVEYSLFAKCSEITFKPPRDDHTKVLEEELDTSGAEETYSKKCLTSLFSAGSLQNFKLTISETLFVFSSQRFFDCSTNFFGKHKKLGFVEL